MEQSVSQLELSLTFLFSHLGATKTAISAQLMKMSPLVSETTKKSTAIRHPTSMTSIDQMVKPLPSFKGPIFSEPLRGYLQNT